MAHSAAMTKQKTTGEKIVRRRAVRVHGLDDALRTCAVANELEVAITLMSASAAVRSMGPAWFRNIAREVEQAYPDLDFEAVLDCGDAAGYALAALRAGVETIRFSGNASASGKIREIAAMYGSRVTRKPTQILDIRGAPNAEAALRKWLGAK